MNRVLSYKAGEIIFKAGECQNWMYLISWGKIGIYADYEGDRKLLTTLGAEDFFGEMGMIEGAPRSATAVAMEESRCFLITEENFIEYCKEVPIKANMILQSTSQRIRDLSKDYIEACQAIGEYVKAEEAGKAPDKVLMTRMKKIADTVKGE